jgi:hypothetical protein
MMPKDRRARLSRRLGILLVALCLVLVASVQAAESAGSGQPRDMGVLIGGIVTLVIATAVSGWYFGRPLRKVPYLLGIAAFGAACGIGIGLTSTDAFAEDAFASLVASLATAFGGALVCAVSARAHEAKARTSDMVSYASAASGIPLLLGIYFGSSLATGVSDIWTGDVHRMAAVTIALAVTLAVGTAVGRRTQDVPLCLGAAAFGAFVGIATGFSKDPAVAYVAPATLALFTGAASYAFTAGPRERGNIGGILFCFGTLAVVGFFLGAAGRVGLAWSDMPVVLYGFVALLIPSLALGSAVGAMNQDRHSSLGFAALGSAVGLAIGLSRKPVAWIVTPSLLAVMGVLAIYVFSANSEDRKIFSRLLATFAVLVLLSSFVGFSLRQMTPASLSLALGGGPEAVALADRQGEGPTEGTFGGYIWLEGRATSSAVAIEVRGNLGGRLRVVERVDGQVRYEGLPARGEQLRLSGESLEISWPASAGRGSLSIAGWDRMIEQEGKWTVTGNGEPLDLSKARLEGDRLVIIYPPSP